MAVSGDIAIPDPEAEAELHRVRKEEAELEIHLRAEKERLLEQSLTNLNVNDNAVGDDDTKDIVDDEAITVRPKKER